jgi:hypothetical protein
MLETGLESNWLSSGWRGLMQDYMKCKPTLATDFQTFNHIQSHKYFALRNVSGSAGKLLQSHHKRHIIPETWRREEGIVGGCIS